MIKFDHILIMFRASKTDLLGEHPEQKWWFLTQWCPLCATLLSHWDTGSPTWNGTVTAVLYCISADIKSILGFFHLPYSNKTLILMWNTPGRRAQSLMIWFWPQEAHFSYLLLMYSQLTWRKQLKIKRESRQFLAFYDCTFCHSSLQNKEKKRSPCYLM